MTIPRPKRQVVRFPVAEIFGPTIQGEGPLSGSLTDFVRFWGCNFRCLFCDSLHAVLPEYRKQAEELEVDEIVSRLSDAKWVTLSGGNPALYELTELVAKLHRSGRRVAIETQGVGFHDWIARVDQLIVSPKPPSAGENSTTSPSQFRTFLSQLSQSAHAQQMGLPSTAIKVVVFNDEDYLYASSIKMICDEQALPFYFSVGNDVGKDSTENLLEKTRNLITKVGADPVMRGAFVLPQIHVLLWGNEIGH